MAGSSQAPAFQPHPSTLVTRDITSRLSRPSAAGNLGSDAHLRYGFARKPAYGNLPRMKMTAVFEPAKEGGYTCFVEEIPAAISQGETLDEARANLLDALKLVLECQRELAVKNLSPEAVRETIELADA